MTYFKNYEELIRIFIIVLVLMGIGVLFFGFDFIFATAPASWSQQHFRFKNDTGGEISTDWIDIEDANISRDKNDPFRIRIHFDQAGNSAYTITPLLEYKAASGGTCADTTAWTAISTSETNAFALATSSNFTEPVATTNQLTAIQTFTAGQLLDQTNPGTNSTLQKQSTEYAWNVKATSNSSYDVAYIFRVSNNGTNLTNYNACPQVTVFTNSPPNQPTNVSPGDGDPGISVNPTLTGSTYSDSESDPHTDTYWQVDNDSGFSSPVWTRTAGGGGEESIVVNSTNGTFANELAGQTQLAYETIYYWQVQYSDGVGGWSALSTSTYFTTEALAPSSVSCSTDFSSTSFGSWASGDTSIKTSSPNASTTMSCSNTSGGCTLYVNDLGNEGNPGLWNSSASYLIASADATLSAGVDGYGIQATSTSPGLTIDAKYNNINNTVGGLITSNQPLASSIADISGAEVVTTHKAAISENALSGSYTDTITYECVVN